MVHTHEQASIITVLWNQAVHTDREVTANRPDVIIKSKKDETCTLIDTSVFVCTASVYCASTGPNFFHDPIHFLVL